MSLSTTYCPYCGREIPQFPTGARRPGEYCYDDCPEGEGKRIAIFPKKPVPVIRRKKDYVPGSSGMFKRHDGTEFDQRKKRR